MREEQTGVHVLAGEDMEEGTCVQPWLASVELSEQSFM